LITQEKFYLKLLSPIDLRSSYTFVWWWVLVEYGISLEDFKLISQRDILNNIPTWRYYQYKLSKIS